MVLEFSFTWMIMGKRKVQSKCTWYFNMTEKNSSRKRQVLMSPLLYVNLLEQINNA